MVPLVGCVPPELERKWLVRRGSKVSTGFGRDEGETEQGPVSIDAGDARVVIGGN